MSLKVFTSTEGFVAAIGGVQYVVGDGEHHSDEFPPVKALPHLWEPFSDPAGAPAIADPVSPKAAPAPEPEPETPEPEPEPEPEVQTKASTERPPADGDITTLRAFAKSLGLDLPGNVSRVAVNEAIDEKLTDPA